MSKKNIPVISINSKKISGKNTTYVIEANIIRDGKHHDITATLYEMWDKNSAFHEYEMTILDDESDLKVKDLTDEEFKTLKMLATFHLN